MRPSRPGRIAAGSVCRRVLKGILRQIRPREDPRRCSGPAGPPLALRPALPWSERTLVMAANIFHERLNPSTDVPVINRSVKLLRWDTSTFFHPVPTLRVSRSVAATALTLTQINMPRCCEGSLLRRMTPGESQSARGGVCCGCQSTRDLRPGRIQR